MMAKRTDLHAYRDSIAERLAAAAAGDPAPALLGFESGGERWLVELPAAGEVQALPPLTTVPLTQPWFAGLAAAHGELQAVVDFSVYCGRAPTALQNAARLLCVGRRFRSPVALLVDRVCGLRRIDSLQPDVTPATEPSAAWRGIRLVDAQGERWIRLDIERLLAEPALRDAALPDGPPV